MTEKQSLKGVRIGFALCGSYCVFSKVFPLVGKLLGEGAEVFPIVSENVAVTDSRFGAAREHLEYLEQATGKSVIRTIAQAEPIGPKKMLDILLIEPCTGNTMAKLAAGIADTTVTLAAKAHLRNQRPIVLAVSSNDALAGNAASLGRLLDRRGFYFVPFRQDDPQGKPRSLVADFTQTPETIREALEGRQIQPLLI